MSTSARQQPAPPACTGQAAIVVEIADTQGFLAVEPDGLVRLIVGVLENEGVARAAISLALVDNATIRRINRKHLAHDWPTDVISFTLSDPGKPELVGELVVSTEMAAASAAELGIDAAAELALYVVHGSLHLCGYEDSTDLDIQKMRSREHTHLARLGVAEASGLARLSRPGPKQEEQAPWSG